MAKHGTSPIPLIGYSPSPSVGATEEISFMVSSTCSGPFEAQLVRVLCADANPYGPGYREVEIDSSVNGTYPSAFQPAATGSYATTRPIPFDAPGVVVSATIWPTLRSGVLQAIVSRGDATLNDGFCLALDGKGRPCFRFGGAQVTLDLGLRLRHWYRLSGGYDPATGRIWARAEPSRPAAGETRAHFVDKTLSATSLPDRSSPAAMVIAAISGPEGVTAHFNGKIEAPFVQSVDGNGGNVPFAAWDFSQGIDTQRIIDTGPNGLDGQLENLPTRGMTGSRWDGSCMRWADNPTHYAAIHFHEDDIHDCRWQPSATWTVPDGFPSGVYALRLRAEGHEDHIPFVVRPDPERPRAQVLFVMPTFTYLAYANFASLGFDDRAFQRVLAWGAYPHMPRDHDEYGLSLYDHHSDGSGTAFSSWRRPNLFMRPRFIAASDPRGSGLRHYAADTYITAWLEQAGVPYEVMTDHDVHRLGAEALLRYRCVITGTHPEYHTLESLDAFQGFVDGGGRLMYMGGNGFYWRIAVSEAVPGAIELRRAESGVRLWASEPGEYYHAFNGSYGGLWRRNGRPPNRLVGVGFSSQGDYAGSYYRRAAGSHDPRAAFVFEGLESEEFLGDFGFFGGGAAGFELDRADTALGTPDHALVLATSENHGGMYGSVPEELLRQFQHRPASEVLRADMLFFETPAGGAVFSTGSITYCGSLPYMTYDNAIARLTTNVLMRFIDPEPFVMPGRPETGQRPVAFGCAPEVE